MTINRGKRKYLGIKLIVTCYHSLMIASSLLLLLSINLITWVSILQFHLLLVIFILAVCHDQVIFQICFPHLLCQSSQLHVSTPHQQACCVQESFASSDFHHPPLAISSHPCFPITQQLHHEQGSFASSLGNWVHWHLSLKERLQGISFLTVSEKPLKYFPYSSHFLQNKCSLIWREPTNFSFWL